jgi:hypothetical protein
MDSKGFGSGERIQTFIDRFRGDYPVELDDPGIENPVISLTGKRLASR